ncbi:MAG: cobalamin-dependent protein [Deltaproteobacteria bacterium]|nr:cobalamin-dependent protein [Deltaproteobacteria bacterium]
MTKSLSEAVVTFDESAVLTIVEQKLADNTDPISVVRELQEGMRIVGEKFNEGTYFLSELLMSADLFTRSMKMLEPKLVGITQDVIGKIVLGTPKGDIHDLGKNIFRDVAKAAGFEIHDLGIDVPVDKFVAKIEEVKPDIVGMSALITTGFETMKQIVDTLVEKGLRDQIKVIVGGGVITETVQTHVGADAHTTDALQGVAICKEFMGIA